MSALFASSVLALWRDTQTLDQALSLDVIQSLYAIRTSDSCRARSEYFFHSRFTVPWHPTSVRLGGERLQTADQELNRQTIGICPRRPIHELARGAREVGELASGKPFHGRLLAVGVRRKIA